MFSGIFFSICGLLIVAAIIYMILHRNKVKNQEKPDNPMSEQDFSRDGTIPVNKEENRSN